MSVDIVTAFARAGATTVAVDIDPLAPTLHHADRYALVLRVGEFREGVVMTRFLSQLVLASSDGGLEPLLDELAPRSG